MRTTIPFVSGTSAHQLLPIKTSSENLEDKIIPFPESKPSKPKFTGAYLFAYGSDENNLNYGIVSSISGNSVKIDSGFPSYQNAAKFARKSHPVIARMGGYALQDDLRICGHEDTVKELPKNLYGGLAPK